jgi:hypothetical protein
MQLILTPFLRELIDEVHGYFMKKNSMAHPANFNDCTKKIFGL